MLGIFFAATALIASGFNSLGNWLDDENTRLKAKNAGRKYYYDKRSCMREVDTNKPVYFYTNMDGDYVQTDPRTGTVVRNITKEQNAKREAHFRQIALDNGYDTYQIGGEFDNHPVDRCKGFRFKSIETEEIFVIREIYGAFYYMRVCDGQIVKEVERNPNNKTFIRKNDDIDYDKYRKIVLDRVNTNNLKESKINNQSYSMDFLNHADRGSFFLIGKDYD